MTEALDEIYRRCDTEEMACQQAQERYEAARTPVGRFLAKLSLASHLFRLADAYEEAETGEFQAVNIAKE